MLIILGWIASIDTLLKLGKKAKPYDINTVLITMKRKHKSKALVIIIIKKKKIKRWW